MSSSVYVTALLLWNTDRSRKWDCKDIFTNPQHVTTKKFVNSAFAAKIPKEVQKELQSTGEIVTLSFIGTTSGNLP